MRPIVFILLLLAPVAGRAAPEHYRLDPDATQVGFTWYFGTAPVEGSMPVQAAEVTLDFARLEGSHFTVTLDATAAKAGGFFASQGLQGRTMLDTGTYPTLRYAAERVIRSGGDTRAEGRVTIRGVEKPLTMEARFLRPVGQPAGERSHLVVLLDGSFDRTEFGVNGWPGAVGRRIDLHIRAVLDRIPVDG